MEFQNRGRSHNLTALLLRDLIQERTGICFNDNNMDLITDKLSSLVLERGAGSLLDFYYRLKYDNDQAEWSSLVDAITVRETFFWREFDQIRSLVDVLMPRLAETSPKPVRIWSAACASGEEPLTIAMALELAGWFDRVPIEIHASDASCQALRVAKAGVYRERSFRAFPREHRNRFFEAAENGWRVRPCLHRRVQWHQANLTDEAAVAALSCVPVIFCRNVFIYFSDATILKIVKRFEQNMYRPGYLFVAAAESLLKFDIDLDLQEIGGAFVYVRK
jgi:chemotaxis protein methyltransferase CheR